MFSATTPAGFGLDGAPADLPAFWPHRGRSHVCTVGRLRWHLQHWPAPEAPPAAASPGDRRRPPRILLLHGTGASAHSWHALAPLLAEGAEVIAPDLPGHAFTQTPDEQDLSIDGVSRALRALLNRLDWRPSCVIGHSAGAAVACRMALDSMITPRQLIAINGALLPLQGPVGRMFLPLARLLSSQAYVPAAFAGWASLPGITPRLLAGTGSRIDALSQRCYRQLVADPTHVAGALRLMAAWNLEPLQRDLSRLAAPLRLIVGGGDRMLAPSHAQRVQALLPSAERCLLPGLGHLAHEEDAATVAAWCRAAAATVRAGRGPAALSAALAGDGSAGRSLRA